MQQTNNEVSPGCDTLLLLVQNKFHFHHFLFTPQELCHEEDKKREITKKDLCSIYDKELQIITGFCLALVIRFPMISSHLLKQAFFT